MAAISATDVKALRERTGAGMMDCKKALAEADGDMDKAVEVLRERGLAKAARREGRATTEGTVAMAIRGAAGALAELGCETDFVAKTDDFQTLATDVARALASDPSLADLEKTVEAPLDGARVTDRIAESVGKLGENIVLKRVARVATDGPGCAGGYVHAGGRLGVVVALATEAEGEALEALAKDVAMHVAAADPVPVAVAREGVPAELVEKERALFRRQAEQEGKPDKILDRIVDGKINKFYAEVCLVEQPFVKDPDRTVGQVLEQVGQELGAEVRVADFVRFRLGEDQSA